MQPGPLDGILVADFSRVLAGPLCAMQLGDLGAEVVKVERPDGGDDTRVWGPPFTEDGTSTYYLALNRNKRSVTLDLKDRTDLGLARALARRADVVISSFRPGLMASFGLDHATLAAEDPRTISCEVSAFGSGEAAAALPGYDLLLQAMSGLMSVTGEAARPPVRVGVALIDVMTGLQSTIGVLAALAARERSGEGQLVEISLMDTALAGMANLASGYLNAGAVPSRWGTGHPSLAPYATFPAADREFCIAVGNDRGYARLCTAIGRPDLIDDARFSVNAARLANRSELESELATALKRRDAREWIELLTAAGVPAGPINDVGEAFALAEELGLAAGRRDRRHPHTATRRATERHARERPPRSARARRARRRDPSLAAGRLNNRRCDRATLPAVRPRRPPWPDGSPWAA